MKIAQLFGVKTNPSQQPRCCHKRNDGTECRANPRTGKQYCFFHDPAAQKKSAAARRAGGVLRRRNPPATPQAIPELACLLAKPMREASGVAEFLNEVARQFCQGNIDLRAAAEMRQCALAVLRTFEFEARNQREANRQASRPAKKQPIERINFVVRDIVTGAVYDPHKTVDASTPKPFSQPGQPDPKPDTKEDKPDQGRQHSVSPTSATSAQNQAKAHPQNEQDEPQQNEQNEPQPNEQNKPQPNGQSAMSPALPAAQPVAPASQENPPVRYPPGLGPRYVQVATPEMPWWRRPQFGNPGFVTGTVPQTARMPAPAKRFRGTRR